MNRCLAVWAAAMILTVHGGGLVYAGMPIGHLDQAEPTWVGGWAFDPDHPEAEIAVHVYVNGQMAGNSTTTGFRPDVNAAYGITGNHGFTFPVDIAAFGPGTHDVCVYGIDLDGEGNPAFDPCPYKVTISCTPNCSGKACGDDGCGGSCGNCQAPQTCQNGQCVGGGNPGSTGNLDVANQDVIGGWAKDPDWDGPIQVHIYVDDTLVKAIQASDWREDVGAHGFSWNPPAFGHGNHSVKAYAIGVNGNGAPDGQNPMLPGSPKTLTANCDDLTSDALGWCNGLPGYWLNRQADTVFVDNSTVRVGVNKSYGGTIFQFCGPDWDRNLVLEHGGGAVQLSIWGYDPVGGVGWYGTDSCDPQWYSSLDSCLAAGHSGCSPWAHPGGAHAANCTSVKPCGGWTPGAPWNPIQAQGPDCGWDSPGNDCNAANWEGSSFYTRLDGPYHFTHTHPACPMPMEQRVTAHQGYAQIDYRLTYSGPHTWTPHPQEIPAIFTAAGMHAHFYYYGGDAPFTGDTVTHQNGPTTSFLRYPDRDIYGHGDNFSGYVKEGWWGACDNAQERCITVASFSPLMNEVATHQNQSGGSGYITALGYFGVEPGMDLQWTIYLFPHRYDHDIGGKTVRQRIVELAPDDFKTQPCQPACGGKGCGSDGCGGSCGACGSGETCSPGGQCIPEACQPHCAGKSCGADGCGGLCGTCDEGDFCTDDGLCVATCQPDCEAKQCGPDGCGGMCGACGFGMACVAGQCQPDTSEFPDAGGVDDVVSGLDSGSQGDWGNAGGEFVAGSDQKTPGSGEDGGAIGEDGALLNGDTLTVAGAENDSRKHSRGCHSHGDPTPGSALWGLLLCGLLVWGRVRCEDSSSCALSTRRDRP